MAVEESIAQALLLGASPKELVARGFAKSTVYKVLRSFRWSQVSLKYVSWVQGWQTNKGRYLPGETAQVTFSIQNPLPYDFYVAAVGMRPEWLDRGLWYSVQARRLFHPGEQERFSLFLPVPSGLDLGEKAVWAGVEGQVVGPGINSPGYGVIWDPPFILRVQHPARGFRVFLSHSVADIYLVHELASYLDNHGLEPIVAEDQPMPGSVLPEKFTQLIESSDLFIALLTSPAARSKWVHFEIATAHRLGKPTIVLKEASVNVEAPLGPSREYIEFDIRSGPEHLIEKVHEGLPRILQQIRRPLSDAVVYVLLAGFIGFLLGTASAKSA